MASSYPNNLNDVIGLIHRLYQPATPRDLEKTQGILQQAQRSSEGWQIADSLLADKNEHVQFFGALTFTVKINLDWFVLPKVIRSFVLEYHNSLLLRQSIPEHEISTLLSRLLDWLVKLVSAGSSQLVVKKICSTLVVFFIRFSKIWRFPIKHVVSCLSTGQVMSLETLEKINLPRCLPHSLKAREHIAALWFATILVEEVGKVDYKNVENLHYHHTIHSNTDETAALIFDAIDLQNGISCVDRLSDVVDVGLKAYQSWVFYSFRASIDTRLDFASLKSLMRPTIGWLATDQHFETACDVIIDIMLHSFSFLNQNNRTALTDILTSSWAIKRYRAILCGDTDWDSIQFSRLLVTFAEANVEHLARSLDTQQGITIVQMIQGLLTVPGYPKVDEEVSSTTFEFWGSWVEFLLDYQPRPNESSLDWLSYAKRETKSVVEAYWRKIQMPANNDASLWSKDQKDGFMNFRRDVADFVDSAYALLGADIFEQLVGQVVNTLGKDVKENNEIVWEEVEASLFCLNSLSDSLGDEPKEDLFLKSLFASPLFLIMVRFGNWIPLKVKISCVSIIGSYSGFFERSPDLLPPALNFLFTCLSNPLVAGSASRSIASLCSSCRCTLATELDTFLDQYGILIYDSNIDDPVKERVLYAISYIVQALSSDEKKLAPLTKLLTYLEHDSQRSLNCIAQGKRGEAKEIGISTLRCLTSIGKGLQAPDDIPIDLNGDILESPVSFWLHNDGNQLQKKILIIIHALCDALIGDGEIVDAACAVFKTGFTEVVLGLFSFPPNIVTDFLLRYSWRTETILATASTFITSHSVEGSPKIRPQALRLLVHVESLVSTLCNPQNEPEVAQCIVEFLWRLQRRYLDVLVLFEPSSNLETLCIFTINSLSVREPLVKKAAASFWTMFLAVTDQQPNVQAATDEIVRAYGLKLAEKLAWALGGGCQRSEIEVMTETLRKLVERHPSARTWLSIALENIRIVSTNLTATDKRRFVDRVISLRGKRITNQVAKEFWLKSRGTEFAYTS